MCHKQRLGKYLLVGACPLLLLGTPSAIMGERLAGLMETHSSVGTQFIRLPAPTTRAGPVYTNWHRQMIAATGGLLDKKSRIAQLSAARMASSLTFELINYCCFKPLHFGVFFLHSNSGAGLAFQSYLP